MYLVFNLGIGQGARLQTFQIPLEPYMVFYANLCKLSMSPYATIEQYQTSKSTFIHANVYKLQFLKMQYNSHCHTVSV